MNLPEDDSAALSREYGKGKTVVVVGAGPGGLLTALLLAQRGYQVDVSNDPLCLCLELMVNTGKAVVIASFQLLWPRNLPLSLSCANDEAPQDRTVGGFVPPRDSTTPIEARGEREALAAHEILLIGAE